MGPEISIASTLTDTLWYYCWWLRSVRIMSLMLSVQLDTASALGISTGQCLVDFPIMVLSARTSSSSSPLA